MISWRIAVLMLCLWGRHHEISGQYCVEQPSRTQSLEGESVTIPCQFAFPESEDKIKSSTFIVLASKGFFCNGNNAIIYRSDTGTTSPAYQRRLNVYYDLSHRNASITIHNITKEDDKYYCCRIEVKFIGGEQKWQSPYGTQLTVRDELNLKTIPVIYAATGDNVTLLSHFTSNNVTTTSNITCHIGKATNIIGECTTIGSCTYRNDSLYFQINNAVESHTGFYCWRVNISSNNGERKKYYFHGPQLHIIDKTDKLNVTQSEEVEFHRSATINCSFTVQQNNDLIQTEVYWVMGDARESYVYHPNQDYIHPRYRGKTRLVDGSNLLLEDFRGPDNTTVYCRVIIRRCREPLPNNNIVSILEEGPGTRLTVKVVPEPVTTPNPGLNNSMNKKTEQSQIIIIVLCVVLVFLAIFIALVIYIVKKRGNKSNSREATVGTPEAANDLSGGYENPTMIRRQQEAMGEDLVYSTVNHSASTKRQKGPREGAPEQDTEIVYAEVKKS